LLGKLGDGNASFHQFTHCRIVGRLATVPWRLASILAVVLMVRA
jgi:hypothetical protein